MKTVADFRRARDSRRLISMVTCYDAWTAHIVQQSRIDCILVGDSVAMVAHGHETTVPATPEMMAHHTAAVRRGAPDKLIIGDFPFLAHRKGIRSAMEVADQLMKAGAQAVKIEGLRGHEDVIAALVSAGVPVMGHLGLTPQSVHAVGGFKLQGKSTRAAEELLEDAMILERLGCFGLVLEMIPSSLAARVTEALAIPTIGIGAGSGTSGQVLVMQDLLGMNPDFRPRFVRTYLDGFALFRDAFDRFADDVDGAAFPAAAESFE